MEEITADEVKRMYIDRLGEESTPEEVRQEYIDRLGPELGVVFDKLRVEWATGWIKLNEIRSLYGNHENVKYVNSFGGLFFGHIQGILRDDLLLNITRLTDPVNSGGSKKNLTIQLLPNLIDNLDNRELSREEVDECVKTAVESSRFARDWRDRHIAHRDYKLELDAKNAEPLKDANRREIDHALTDVHSVLNLIDERLLDRPMANEVIYPHGIKAMIGEMIGNLKRRGV